MFQEGQKPAFSEITDILNVVKFFKSLNYASQVVRLSPSSIVHDQAHEISKKFGHSSTDIPVFIRSRNESKRLPKTLLALSLCRVTENKVRPIVIDNASEDDTRDVAVALGAEVIDERTKGFNFATRAIFRHASDLSIQKLLILDADSIPVHNLINYMLLNLDGVSSGEIFGLRAYIGGQFLSDQILSLKNLSSDITSAAFHRVARVHGGNAAIKLDQKGKIVKELENIEPNTSMINRTIKRIILKHGGLAFSSFDQSSLVFTDSARFPNLRSVLKLILDREQSLKRAYND